MGVLGVLEKGWVPMGVSVFHRSAVRCHGVPDSPDDPLPDDTRVDELLAGEVAG